MLKKKRFKKQIMSILLSDKFCLLTQTKLPAREILRSLPVEVLTLNNPKYFSIF